LIGVKAPPKMPEITMTTSNSPGGGAQEQAQRRGQTAVDVFGFIAVFARVSPCYDQRPATTSDDSSIISPGKYLAINSAIIDALPPVISNTPLVYPTVLGLR
jgi:hypothetical protein